MNLQQKIVHLSVAFKYAELSKARKKKVGCIIVKNDRIISIGYNGTPPGWDNNCEYEVKIPFKTDDERDAIKHKTQWIDWDDENKTVTVLKTKPEVSHAEHNAIAKLAKSTESGDGATLFTTCAPCVNCAKLIADSGISEVIYSDLYKNSDGVEYLIARGVKVHNSRNMDY